MKLLISLGAKSTSFPALSLTAAYKQALGLAKPEPPSREYGQGTFRARVSSEDPSNTYPILLWTFISRGVCCSSEISMIWAHPEIITGRVTLSKVFNFPELQSKSIKCDAIPLVKDLTSHLTSIGPCHFYLLNVFCDITLSVVVFRKILYW